jgi:hypothetical protein
MMTTARSGVSVLAAFVSFVALSCKTAPPSPAVASSASGAASAAPATDLASGERTRLVGEIGRQLDAHYVFPEVGARMAAAVRDRAAHGAYDGASAKDFARMVTTDMRDVSHDRHAMLEWTPPGAGDADDQVWEAKMAKNRRTSGFTSVERRAGNVAYVVLDSFESPDGARAAVAKHMTDVADAEALIFDLRQNSGGDPDSVALVASYVFDRAPVHLNDLFWRDDGSTEQYFTQRDVAGTRFGAQKPVFIVTSHDTFSAGEEFAYDLQCLHRAEIVGEVTKGGAHPVARQKLSPLFMLRVPTGRAINPITKTNWEGVGVKPDVMVESALAPRTAHARALQAILASSAAPPAKRAAQAALDAMGTPSP